jgi:hypothetical protein
LDLGSRAETRIDALADDLAGEDQPGEGYLAKAGRLGQARRQAEEIVLAEMILLEPEPGASEDEEAPAPPQDRPVIVTRDHPLWEEINAEQQERIHGS